MEQKRVEELVNGILHLMENHIEQIILYGSFARGTHTAESDIDIALLVHGSLNREVEDRLSDFIVDLNLKYDRVLSVIDIELENFRKWEAILPFYKNIQREEVVLWEAA